MKEKVVVYWARRDFRLTDNPALFAAVEYAKNKQLPFLPLFILEDYLANGNPDPQFGYPSRVFLTKALPLFAKQFPNFTAVKGEAAHTIISLSEQLEITVFVNEDVYPDFYTQIKIIQHNGVDIKLYRDALTISKDTKTGTGNIYSVFTPFKKAVWTEFCTAKVVPKVKLDEVQPYTNTLANTHTLECTEESLKKVFSTKRSLVVGEFAYDIDSIFEITPSYDKWYFDETGALAHFNSFLKNKLSDYKKQRDMMASEGTSKMSLALAWGLVSARTLRQKIQTHFPTAFPDMVFDPQLEGPTHYLSELIWREFYKYLFYHYPELMDKEFQPKFRRTIKWIDAETAHYRFKKWIQGETGYPIVDAAMMQLATTGYMHNRARMIVASVLTKNFGVDWRWGQEYFRAMLIDLDEASNNGGWQWAASVGADPKPIRIFNPYLQAENYDTEGLYQKKYLREDYEINPPEIVVEHKAARAEALSRYGLVGSGGAPRDY